MKNPTNQNPSPARLEAFSDGVIAVIITIMVLELKLPPRHSGLTGLSIVIPTLAVYLLSFTSTGIFWINHHELIHRLKLVDHFTLYANLLFLFSLSLVPFFTNYVLDNGIDSFSVALYAGTMIFSGSAFGMLRVAVNRILCLSGELGLADIATQRKHLISLCIYVITIPLAFWQPRLALATIATVTLLWIVPSLGLKAASSTDTEPPFHQVHHP